MLASLSQLVRKPSPVRGGGYQRPEQRTGIAQGTFRLNRPNQPMAGVYMLHGFIKKSVVQYQDEKLAIATNKATGEDPWKLVHRGGGERSLIA